MYFIDEGIRRIRRSADVDSARRSFDRSCTVCCTHGYQIRCEHCKVANAYQQTIEGFNYMINYKNEMKGEVPR